MTSVLFLVKSDKTPSSRVRARQLLPHLERYGIAAEALPLPGTFEARRRLFRRARGYDVVVLQKRLLSYCDFHVLRGNAKKLVFDFDDAIHLRNASPSPLAADYHSSARRRKFRRTVEEVDLVVAANTTLANAAREFNPQAKVEVLPSAIDTGGVRRRADNDLGDPPVVGWVGTSSTLRYLDVIAPALISIAGKRPFILHVVSDGAYSLEGVEVRNITWTLEAQNQEIAAFDVGLMPLSDDPFSAGKAAYKLLQYLAAGVPAVASPVGMNRDIAMAGACLAAGSPADFADAIESLLENEPQRRRLAEAGVELVEKRFAVPVVAAGLAQIIKNL